MRKYELVLVVKPTVKEADRKKLLEQIKGWLGKVKVSKEEEWGQKALAYPIKKQDAGFYYQWQMEGETFPTDFETKVYQNTNVLRHLLLRTK
jgi:small subunit ribosomal protein S6